MSSKDDYPLGNLIAIAGFLFGFDSVVIGGAVGALRDAFEASADESGINVSSMLLGCELGAFAAGGLSDPPGGVWACLNETVGKTLKRNV